MESSKRIVINTLAQYLRTIINIVLSFFSARLIIGILGAEDYGIYTLIAGITSMLSFVTQALVSTTQRYMSFYQGRNDKNAMKAFFSNSILMHLFIGLVFAVILLLLCPLLFNGLNIPMGREDAAISVYYIVVFILIVTFCTAPYRALLVAHENIVFTSIVDVLDGILKVVFVIVLQFVSYDELIAYGIIMLMIHLVNFLLIYIYASQKYEECILPRIQYCSMSYFKELFSFTIWTVYGTGCVVIRTQGLAVVINKSLSTVANAAYGIGLQVSGAVSTVSVALLNAMRPQIVKAEGEGNHQQALSLSITLCKFSLCLLSALCIPCIFEMPTLLSVWLIDVPNHTVLFARMALIATLVDTITLGLNVYCEAIGKIKKYNLVVFTIKICALPIAAIMMYMGWGAISIAIAYIGTEFIAAVIRIPFLRRLGGLEISMFVKEGVIRPIIPILVSILVCAVIVNTLDIDYRFIFTIIISMPIFVIGVFVFGLSSKEKKYILNLLKK